MEKLLEADAQAISIRWEIINPDVGSRRTSRAFSSEGSEGVDVGRGEYSEPEDTEEEAAYHIEPPIGPLANLSPF